MTTPDPDLIASLQTQLRDLQADNETLRSLLNQQQVQARQWLQHRTSELEREAVEQKDAEAMQRVFYRIAERATAGLSFYDFLQVVHQLLRELMFADNFFVALHDYDKGMMDYPYYVDEKDGDTMQRDGVPYKRGMTEFVLESGKPQLMDGARFMALRESGFMAEATTQGAGTWKGVRPPRRPLGRSSSLGASSVPGTARSQEVERWAPWRGTPAYRASTACPTAARIAASCAGDCISSSARVRAVAVWNISNRSSLCSSGTTAGIVSTRTCNQW